MGHHRPSPWFQASRESEPVRWLLKGFTPARTCWYSFRERRGPLLDQLHDQVMALASGAGLTPAPRAAQDGTRVAAHASRHRLVNPPTLDQRHHQLAQAIAHDEAPVAGEPLPAWMARTPWGRRQQHQRLDQARARRDHVQTYHRGQRSSKRKDADNSVVSVSDPEAAVGRDQEKVYRPLYHVQVVDDVDSPFVLGYEVFAQQNDAGLLQPLRERVRPSLGHALQGLLVDGSSTGGADLARAAQTWRPRPPRA